MLLAVHGLALPPRHAGMVGYNNAQEKGVG